MLSAASTLMWSHQLFPSNDDWLSWASADAMKTVVNRSSKNLLNMFPPEPIALQKRTAAAEAAFPPGRGGTTEVVPFPLSMPHASLLLRARDRPIPLLPLHVTQACEAVVDDSLRFLVGAAARALLFHAGN